MNFIGGSDSFRYFKIISVNNKKIKEEGRYKTKGSPGHAAKKAFTQLSKKYKTNKLVFSIKETTQGSLKKEYGLYLGEKIKLKNPLEIKYEGKNKPVIIKYEIKVHLVKDYKQKGGMPKIGLYGYLRSKNLRRESSVFKDITNLINKDIITTANGIDEIISRYNNNIFVPLNQNINNNMNKLKVIIFAHGSVKSDIIIDNPEPFSIITSAEVGYVYGWQKDRASIVFTNYRNTNFFKHKLVNGRQYFKVNDNGLKFQEDLRKHHLKLETYISGINNNKLHVFQRNPIRLLKIHSSNEEGIVEHSFQFYNYETKKSGAGVYVLVDGIWKRLIVYYDVNSPQNIKLEYFSDIYTINDLYREGTAGLNLIKCNLTDIVEKLNLLFPDKEPEILIESCRVFNFNLSNEEKINLIGKTNRYYQQITTHFSENFEESPMTPLRSLKKYEILSTKWNNLNSRNKQILTNINRKRKLLLFTEKVPEISNDNIKNIWDQVLTQDNISNNIDFNNKILISHIIGFIFNKNPYIKIFFYKDGILKKHKSIFKDLEKLNRNGNRNENIDSYLDNITIKLAGISLKDENKLEEFLKNNEVKKNIIDIYF